MRRNEREYRYRRYCDWVWDRFYYSWIQSCRYVYPSIACTFNNIFIILVHMKFLTILLFPSNSLNCAPTNECTDRNQTSDLSRIECCDGYQTRPADNKDHYSYYYQTYYQSTQTIPVGCPRGGWPWDHSICSHIKQPFPSMAYVVSLMGLFNTIGCVCL